MKKRLTVLALAFAMVLTMSASVFATGTRGDLPESEGVANTGFKVYLTKEFNVPEGVALADALPSGGFTFKAEPKAGVTDVDAVPTGEHPTLTFDAISFADNDRAGGADSTDTKLVKTSEKDLTSLTYPRAGVYTWIITENGTDDSKIDYNVGDKTYTLRVYVKNGTNGPEPDLVTVEPEGGKKIDAGKPDSDENADADNDGNKTNDGNDFRFVNNYKPQDVTTNPTDPDTPNDPSDDTGAFKLTKAVTGKYGDKTKKFIFTVNVTLPAGIDAISKAESTEGAGDGWDYSAVTGGELAALKVGDNTVKLADGETFSITKLPEGTKITVKEDGNEHYIPAYDGADTANNGTVATIAHQDGTEDQELAVARAIKVGKKGANVAYTNDFNDSDVTPTGIIINNLPYVLLIGLALGGIVLFSRKRRYE